MNNKVLFLVYQMKESLVVWIGCQNDPSLKELSLAMSTNYEKTPTPIKLFGSVSSITSQALAVRLSKKLKKQVFVSCNVPEEDQAFLTCVEKRLVEEIHNFPACF